MEHPISADSQDYAETYTVDAWGPVTLPGGGVVQALRVRSETRTPLLDVGYIFITKEGFVFTVKAADSTSPSSGIIPVYGIDWIAPTTATDVATDAGRPTEYALLQNYPNPFNPTTTIRYTLPAQSQVTLKIFNAIGQEIATLVDAVQDAGARAVTFDASGLSSGLYLYRLQAGSFVETRSMILMR